MVRGLTHWLGLVVVAIVVVVVGCADRPIEPDFRDVVEEICEGYCSVKLECDPEIFASAAECDESCRGAPYIYNATDCGEAFRNMYDCIGSVATCDIYQDTNNVLAEEYTCQAEKERVVELSCGATNEDPHEGAP